MSIIANWSYPTSIRFGAGRISEIADACAAAGIKKPLLAKSLDDISPLVRRAVALSSLVVWFSVAGAGRWLGFSG